MAEYKITVRKSAVKELENIPGKELQKIIKRIQALAQNPRPFGSQKLSEREFFRVRQGDYRIVYSIRGKDFVVNIVKIGHKREIYRL